MKAASVLVSIPQQGGGHSLGQESLCMLTCKLSDLRKSCSRDRTLSSLFQSTDVAFLISKDCHCCFYEFFFQTCQIQYHMLLSVMCEYPAGEGNQLVLNIQRNAQIRVFHPEPSGVLLVEGRKQSVSEGLKYCQPDSIHHVPRIAHQGYICPQSESSHFGNVKLRFRNDSHSRSEFLNLSGRGVGNIIPAEALVFGWNVNVDKQWDHFFSGCGSRN
eukprot:TRINITY_DN30404_c0_g1_i1.p2 TRINITY_DN30404_c0_g1~~TRINITY_DN30404_c0_g1_i1.p2  ORF type:complete len:216 (+),score=1.44 TRINITY_DN30404_c0_g1_i1:255-902(+)